MDRMVAMARGLQPHLIVVDRTVGGYEDYRTPEQEVPDRPLPYVWESCLTMGTQWSYKPDDRYKSERELIHLLAGIVAKGGNLLLNVGPKPDGTLPEEAVKRLEAIGRWMDVNGEAIHGTRPLPPYRTGQTCLTRKGDTIYGIILAGEGQNEPPAEVRLDSLQAGPEARIRLLGRNEACMFRNESGVLIVTLPAAARKSPPCEHAWTLKITGVR